VSATKSKTSKTSTTATLERESVAVSQKFLTTLARFVEVRDLLNALTKEKKALDEALKEALGSAQVGTHRGKVVVEQSFRSRTTVDTDRLREAFPEAAAACEVVSTYSVLTPKG
jgi:predicted phage-related endonuclease